MYSSLLKEMSMKYRSFFITIIMLFCITILENTNAYADSIAVPYKANGTLGAIVGAKTTANAEVLEKLVEAVQAEGWQISVTKSLGETIAVYTKSNDERLSDIILHKTKGCKTIDERCLRYVEKLNRHLDMSNIDMYQGDIYLPSQEIQFEISIDAGTNYREEKLGQLTKAYMSKKLHAILQPAYEEIVYGRITRFCLGSECAEYYQMTVE